MYAVDHYEIVLCDRNLAELRDILKCKAPKYLPDAEVLIAELPYKLIPAVDHEEKLIRDAKDQPILNAARRMVCFQLAYIITANVQMLPINEINPPITASGSPLAARTTAAEIPPGVNDDPPKISNTMQPAYCFRQHSSVQW